MIVSWNWLREYVALDMSRSELEHRLSMAGLNHESSWQVGRDVAMDLEVTSNRPDCLGHIGVAREISVLWSTPLTTPSPSPVESKSAVDQLCDVSIDCPELCRRYTGRVIRGVKIGPSPSWLAQRLEAVGVAVINNVVDVTNYVMLECGQPLHAFDLSRISGRRIIVREATKDESFVAIDHKTYTLQPGMCVIADAEQALAIGGVMGGESTEVSGDTRDLLIEAADFAPLAVRGAARALRLHSPSSYRFERGVDPNGIDWASRRACELILEVAGGELCSGVRDVQTVDYPSPKPIVLRLSQVPRILGIQLERSRVLSILENLGLHAESMTDGSVTLRPPSWRADLTREIDLIEEVARVHGYDQIPEDVGVPMAASHRGDLDRLLVKIRRTLVGAGFMEAVTPSLVTPECSEAFSPWTQGPAIRSATPALGGADHLRRSLAPSLLLARQTNQAMANPRAELFETAKVYLPRPSGLPEEPLLLAVASSQEFRYVKGLFEALWQVLAIDEPLESRANSACSFLDPTASCRLEAANQTIGYLGRLTDGALKQFGLRSETTVGEFRIDALLGLSNMAPQFQPLSAYPAMTIDLTLVVDESVKWSELRRTVQDAGGALLEEIQFRETYRDPEKDGSRKKRLTFSLVLRSDTETLTGDQAEQLWKSVVARCGRDHEATLIG